MAVTIQKIAELSGVSRGTVDRVLHGRPNVNPMIREKVVRAAEKLGYQPPVPPKSADCRQAAILIPQWTDGHFNRQIVSGIRKALRYIADPAFVLTEQPLRTMTMQELLRAMDEQIRSGVDGLIIRAENTPEVRAAIEQAVQQGVTVITYDADVPDSGRLCHVGQDLSPRRRNRCRRYGAAHSSARARSHRHRQPAYGITQRPCGRLSAAVCSSLGFSEDAYRVIETNEMPELTANSSHSRSSGQPPARGLYGVPAAVRLHFRHPKSTPRRTAAYHLQRPHTCREAVSARRHGGFCRRSDILAGVVSGGFGNVSNAAARCEAEA